MKSRAIRIGPTVCELDGPIPGRKISKTLIIVTPPPQKIHDASLRRDIFIIMHDRAYIRKNPQKLTRAWGRARMP
jgi:hypothetical protein